jgi:D-alanyl-lipoteichoic acid acyltransferase DltB (MBOAT superfamily)
MLFSTPAFVVGFLPIALAGYLAAFRLCGRKGALCWLLAASWFFYAWWKPILLPLLLTSIGVNFLIGRKAAGAKPWLIAGLTFNLALLGFFKYSSLLFGIHGIWLPLGISFFTFQQIMFLVDTFNADIGPVSLLDYACFVAFFPHLIAGPIVRPREIIPQFAALKPKLHLAEGLEIFLLGLAKKRVLADSFARFADPGFAAAARGNPLSLVEAWVALLAYGLQIYFDFSGYSDMAIGLAKMFGIKFPLNFNSPYQAANISDFWQRWNITLSSFLRVYLYIPLGGNRHGAALRFVLWGGLHGLYLVVHGWWKRTGILLPKIVAWATTLLAVMLAWVPFRAQNFAAAMDFYRGLAGFNGFSLPEILLRAAPFLNHFARAVPVLPYLGDARTLSLPQGLLLLALGWAIALALPEVHSMTRTRRNAALVASFALSMQALFFAPYSLPFLYFQF